MGMMSFAIRIGSISAPFTIMLQSSVSWLPSAVYTVLGTVWKLSIKEPGVDYVDKIEFVLYARFSRVFLQMKLN